MPLSPAQQALCEHLTSLADPAGAAAAELARELAGQVDGLWDQLNKLYRQDLAQKEIKQLREQLQQQAERIPSP